MNDLTPALPANPSTTRHTGRSVGWMAGFVVAVGFGFMASTLIVASEPRSDAAGIRPEMAAPADTAVDGPAAGDADSLEVGLAVRNWAWEARSPEQKPSRSYDFEELWLAR